MVLNDDTADHPPLSSDESARITKFAELVRKGLENQADTPADKRKESEAHYFDAVTAETEEDEYECLLMAVRADPANAQALLDLTEFFDLTHEEDLAVVEDILRIAEVRLGEQGLIACAGHFWTFLETRPLMNALLAHADLLLLSGKRASADAEYERLTALDPDDHLGVRLNLVLHYLEAGCIEKARPHLDACQRDDPEHTLFAWCRVLERLLSGDATGAVAALATARRLNGFCEAYIVGHKQLPRDLSSIVHPAPGSRGEAAANAVVLYDTWTPHSEAIKWLFAQPKTDR